MADDQHYFDPFGRTFDAIDISVRGVICIPLPIAALPFILAGIEPLRHGTQWEGTDAERALVAAQFGDLIAALVLHDECQQPQPENVVNEVIKMCASGHTIESIKRMVTKVFIDEDTGELVVQDGQCCEVRYSLAHYVGLEVFEEDPVELGFELPDTDPAPDYSACAQAHALADVVYGIIDFIFDAVGPDDPWSLTNNIKKAYPAINFGDIALFTAVTAGYNVALFGAASELEADRLKDTVIADWSLIFAGGPSGIGKSDFEAAQSAIVSRTRTVFNAPELFLIGGSAQDMVYQTMQAIGPGDGKKITTMQIDDGVEDCGYPDAEPIEFAGDLIFTGSVSDVTTHGDQSITWLNQGKTLNVKVSNITAGSYKGLVDDTEFYMQVLNGGTVASFKVAVEMIQGNLSQEWRSASCGIQPSTAWSVSGDTGEVRTDYGGGDSITEGTPDAGWTSVGYMTADVRFCPHDDLEGQTVEFNMHIIEVNGTPTGISNPHAGKTPL